MSCEGRCEGEDILKEGVCQTLVFVLFEPEKFNKHKQKQRGGRCPRCKRGYLCCLFLVRVSQDLKSGTAAKDTPLSFFVCSKNSEMLHSGFGYLTELF